MSGIRKGYCWLLPCLTLITASVQAQTVGESPLGSAVERQLPVEQPLPWARDPEQIKTEAGDRLEKRKVPTLLHFAESDQHIPFEKVVRFRAFRPDVSAFAYPDVGHGFNCDERDSYDSGAAEAALERTLFWVSQYVEGQPPILLKNSGAYAQAKVDKKKKKKPAGGDDLGPPMD